MTWNYRVIQTDYEGEKFYSVHEVFYNDTTGDIDGWTQEPIDLGNHNSVKELLAVLNMIKGDIKRMPVLTVDDTGFKLIEVTE